MPKRESNPKLSKKLSHNAVERRYRNNINDRISELKNVVPALKHAKLKEKTTHDSGEEEEAEEEEIEEEDYLEGVAVAKKLNKATILRKATEYILHLKKTEIFTKSENTQLQEVLSQLPGGQDALSRYNKQQDQRKKEIKAFKRNQLELENPDQQRQGENNRKKRYRKSTCDIHEYEPVASTSHSSTLIKGISQRVFMAVFMAISFFSSQPLQTTPEHSNRHPLSNTHASVSDSVSYRGIEQNSATENQSTPNVMYGSALGPFLDPLFSLKNKWATLQNTVIAVCAIYAILPFLKYLFFKQSFKINKIKKAKQASFRRQRLSKINARPEIHTTPGDKRCNKIYQILTSSLSEEDTIPRNTLQTVFYITKELICLFLRHVLGYEILYCHHSQFTIQKEWMRASQWVKLNEIECLGGNLSLTRMSMLYSCLRMINLVESLNEEDHMRAEQIRPRAYANVAMEVSLIIPFPSIANHLSHYFWSLSMYEACTEDDSVTRALVWDYREDDAEDRIESMLKSKAWSETIEVMQHQIGRFGHTQSKGLSLSMTAPVLVPVAILSTLHLLDNLQAQFGRLVVTITGVPLTTTAASESCSDFCETTFDHILEITAPRSTHVGTGKNNNRQPLAHWLAAIGATVEALWKSDMKTVEQWIALIEQNIPHSLIIMEVEAEDSVGYKAEMNHIDELTKKSMIHVLLGASLLKSDEQDKQYQGIEELEKAQKLRCDIKKMLSRQANKPSSKNQGFSDMQRGLDLESGTMALAEFVVGLAGLEAWISAWKLAGQIKTQKECNHWERKVENQVCTATLTLRRMIRRHSLGRLRTNQAMVDCLSRLGSFVSQHFDGVDSMHDTLPTRSSFHCSSENENDTCCGIEDSLLKRKDTALSILRGLA
ncbi:hypothetical protein BDF14DRAFT_1874652 [Spinellus fusiger]|nr:hypothetical protein BDF14DRAFT_1874652 [Spinellus fusiger]